MSSGSAGTLSISVAAQTGPLAQGMKEAQAILRRHQVYVDEAGNLIAGSSRRMSDSLVTAATNARRAFGSMAIGISSAASAAQGADKNVVQLGANMAAAFASGGAPGLALAGAATMFGVLAGHAAEAAANVERLKAHLSRMGDIRMGEMASVFGSLDALRSQISDARSGEAPGTAARIQERARRRAELVKLRGQAENDILTDEDMLQQIHNRSIPQRALGLLSGVGWDKEPKREALEANLADAKARRAAAVAELEADQEKESLERQLDDAKTITEARKYGIELIGRLQAKQDAAAKAAGDERYLASKEGAEKRIELANRLFDSQRRQLEDLDRLREEAERGRERGKQADLDQVEAMKNLIQLEWDRIEAKKQAADEEERMAAQRRADAQRAQEDAQKAQRGYRDSQYASGYGPLAQRRDAQRADRNIARFRNHEDNLRAEQRDAASWYAGTNIRADGTGWGPGAQGGTNDFFASDLGSYFGRSMRPKPDYGGQVGPGLLNPGVGANGEVPEQLGNAANAVGAAGDAALGAGQKLGDSAKALDEGAGKMTEGGNLLGVAADKLKGVADGLSSGVDAMATAIQSVTDALANLQSKLETAGFLGQ